MDPSQESELRQRLEALREEHRDLDEAVARLAEEPAMNQLQLTRLKKRKLQLKDAIAHIESQLIPDLNA
ncbi:MAG: YdcH family protein [Thiohalospira sp.]